MCGRAKLPDDVSEIKLDLKIDFDEIGDYRQIVSLPNPPIEAIATPVQAVELARAANDGMAELVQRHRDRFPAFVAALPMLDMPATMAEIKRAIETLGARGVQIFTNINGRPLDDPEFQPIFAAMAKYDLPIWLHPARPANRTPVPSGPTNGRRPPDPRSRPRRTKPARDRAANSPAAGPAAVDDKLWRAVPA